MLYLQVALDYDDLFVGVGREGGWRVGCGRFVGGFYFVILLVVGQRCRVGSYCFVDFVVVVWFVDVWIFVGVLGYSGLVKAQCQDLFDVCFGVDGWWYVYVVRGEVVLFVVAIVEYEEVYCWFFWVCFVLVVFLVVECGNVYDYEVVNVFDDDYVQFGLIVNYYQDVVVCRVVVEFVDDLVWFDVMDIGTVEVDFVDVGMGETYRVLRVCGFRGGLLLQICEFMLFGYCFNLVVVFVHDFVFIIIMLGDHSWFYDEGCVYLLIEVFWQMLKVVEVCYDRFLVLIDDEWLYLFEGA